MKRVAITGGIGSGKSTVCRMLAEVGGVEVYDSDTRAKEIMNSHPEVVAAVKALFGPEAYADGALNRAHVAAVAFGNEDLLGRLNAIVHPAVVADFENGSGRYDAALSPGGCRSGDERRGQETTRGRSPTRSPRR